MSNSGERPTPMTGQPTPPPSFATLARLITEGGEALAAEITRRLEETRPAMEALTRQLAANHEAAVRTFGAGMAQIARSVQPSARPAVTVEQLLELARPYTDRPELGRLEVGVLALKALTDAYQPGQPGPADPLGATYGALALYGVPIVTPDGMDPDAWRLLDTDGRVIKDGTL